MTQEHPNLAIVGRFNPADLASCEDVFSEDAVFHFFNPKLPEVQGDYVGMDGIRSFFATIGQVTKGSFRVNPVSQTAVGDELVVVHTRNSLTLNDQALELDVVVVFRIVEGRITEVWDIPSAYNARPSQQ